MVVVGFHHFAGRGGGGERGVVLDHFFFCFGRKQSSLVWYFPVAVGVSV